MEREKIAANVMLGAYGGESLLFAETAYTLGAIQIVGTTNTLGAILGQEGTRYLVLGLILLGGLIGPPATPKCWSVS